MLKEVRAKLDEIVRSDNRTIKGLDGTQTRYLDFQMPLKAVQMLGFLRGKYQKFCSIEQVHEAAELFASATCCS